MNCMKEDSIEEKMDLSKDEQIIFRIAIEEYNDLFNKILEIPQNNFISTLEKFIQISLVSKNMILPSGTISKILQIIDNKYYQPEYEKIQYLIDSINNISQCEKFTGNNFYPHCNYCKEPIHSCGKNLFILNKNEYLLCLSCKKIYHSNLIELYCQKCNCNYYTGINNNLKEKYQIATWSNYHCNAIMNDFMKCYKCKKKLYLNLENNKLHCKNCSIEIPQNLIKWNCIICNKEFSSDAKIYNPIEFKMFSICIKETIFNGVEAKPEIIPCCNIKREEISRIKFIHKKECNGCLFEGILNRKKVIVCGKCHMLNFYEFHKWFCPICKNRFCLIDYKNEINLQRRITKSARKVNSKNYFNEDICKSNFDNVKLRKYTSKKNPNCINLDNNFNSFSSISEIKKAILRNNIPFSHNFYDRGFSSGNIQFNLKDSDIYEENKKEISEFDLEKNERKKLIKMYSSGMSPINNRKLKINQSLSPYKLEKRLSNININLNLNVNINNNNKIPFLSERYNTSNTNFTNSNYQTSYTEKNFSSDDYMIISQIGEGTFGKIYKVKGKNNSIYAMKKIVANSIKEVNTIKSEYKMLLSLSKYKLNLVKIYGIETKQLDKTTFVIYVLMDIASRDWEKEILLRSKQKKFYTENELLRILTELVSTFAELQRHNISHRDIKPQNILLFPDNSFKISDFGEAKNLSSNNKSTINQTIRGTELYMSPILFYSLKKKNISKYTQHNTFKSDVFSLGLCLLFASTLTFNSLYEIRELNNNILIKRSLNKYLQRYSSKFTDILYLMLELDEKYRDDFIQLEKRIEFI